MTKDEAYHRVVRAVKAAYPDTAEEILERAMPPAKSNAYRVKPMNMYGKGTVFGILENARASAKALIGHKPYSWGNEKIEKVGLWMRFDEQLIETFTTDSPNGDGFREDSIPDEKDDEG